MWDHWNKVLHNDPRLQQAIVQSTVNLQVQHLYAGRVQQLPCNTLHLIAQPLEVILRCSEASKLQRVDSMWATQCRRQQHELALTYKNNGSWCNDGQSHIHAPHNTFNLTEPTSPWLRSILIICSGSHHKSEIRASYPDTNGHSSLWCNPDEN